MAVSSASTFWRYNGEKPLEKPDFKHHTKSAFLKILCSFFDEKISPPFMTGNFE